MCWHVWELDERGRVQGAGDMAQGTVNSDQRTVIGRQRAERNMRGRGLAGEVSLGKKREASSRKRSLCGEPLNVGEG